MRERGRGEFKKLPSPLVYPKGIKERVGVRGELLFDSVLGRMVQVKDKPASYGLPHPSRADAGADHAMSRNS